MKIRSLCSSILALAMVSMASADDAPARLMFPDGSHDDVLLTLYKNGTIQYKLNARDLNRTVKRKAQYESIYFYEPPIFAKAMSLYQGLKYEEAREEFLKCEKAFKAVDTAPNNFASLAGFYAMECSRRMFDLDSLSSAMEKFRKEGLTRETHLMQLEVNAFWEAVRLKDWERLDRLAQSWRKRKVAGNQRAQIAYCHGRALEQLAKKNPKYLSKALNAYNRTLTADFTASREIVIDAANRSLDIYSSDPAVKLAMKLWGTEDEDPNSSGHQRLLEANTLTKLYKQAGFEASKPLDAAHRLFLKYEGPKDDLDL